MTARCGLCRRYMARPYHDIGLRRTNDDVVIPVCRACADYEGGAVEYGEAVE